MLKFFIFLCLPILCFSQEISQLKNSLLLGKKGEFVVAAHQKNYTLWHVKDRTEDRILFEEISVPIKRLKLNENGWQGWVDDNGPQHIGWVMYSIDLKIGKVTGLYSFDEGCWLSAEAPNRFLSTLLNVPFYLVGDQERRRGGKNSQFNAYWNPPLFYEGCEIPGESFSQYITRWPMDGTELSNKKVEVFLLNSTMYPSFFPYWLQVSGGFGKVSIRIVDGGKNLSTKTNEMWNPVKLSTVDN